MARSNSVSITATKVGDWGKAARKIRELRRVYPEVSAIVNAQAYRSAQRIKNKIRAQEYAWPPLADSTVQRKKYENLDPRMLIATGEYINAIKVIPMGPGLWAIGIPAGAKNYEGESLAQIGIWHEYGTDNMPPRPHWRQEYRTFQGQVTSAINVVLATKT